MPTKTFKLNRVFDGSYDFKYVIVSKYWRPRTITVPVCIRELKWLFTEFNPSRADNRPIWLTVSDEPMEDSVELYAVYIYPPLTSLSFELNALSYGQPSDPANYRFISTSLNLDIALSNLFGNGFVKFYVKLEVCDD